MRDGSLRLWSLHSVVLRVLAPLDDGEAPYISRLPASHSSHCRLLQPSTRDVRQVLSYHRLKTLAPRELRYSSGSTEQLSVAKGVH